MEQEELDCNVRTALYLITIATRLLGRATLDEQHLIRRHVFTLNRLDVRAKDGSSLLHLAANGDTPVDEFHTSDICHFPCAVTVKLLIQVRAALISIMSRLTIFKVVRSISCNMVSRSMFSRSNLVQLGQIPRNRLRTSSKSKWQ